MHTTNIAGPLTVGDYENSLHAHHQCVKKSRNFQPPVVLCLSKLLCFCKITKSKHAMHSSVPFNSGRVCTHGRYPFDIGTKTRLSIMSCDLSRRLMPITTSSLCVTYSGTDH